MAINDNTAKWRVKKLGNIVGSNGYWQPNEEVKVGTIRFPMGEDNIGYVLECVEAGTTGEEQPTLIGEELANYAEVGRVGQVRVIFNLAEKDVDEVMAMGITYSRLTYPELWEWAGKRAGLIISEEEWQAKFAETNGKFVPYYSSGDGSSTFRTPLLGAYLKGAETSADVGKWLDAGLPNITGTTTTQVRTNQTDLTGGAFYKHTTYDSNINANYTANGDAESGAYGFDASRSNPIYGKSDTVTPETMTGVWVIKAVGVVVDSGETDVAQVLTATEQVQERVSVVEDVLPKKANLGALSMPSEKFININYNTFTPNSSSWSDLLYTVPADGWVVVVANTGTLSNTRSVVQVINQNNNVGVTELAYGIDWSIRRVSAPFSKGQIAEISVVNMSNIIECKFVYAQSEV